MNSTGAPRPQERSTTLELSYLPADFLEAPIAFTMNGFALEIRDGFARARLFQPVEDVPADLLSTFTSSVEAALRVRMVQTRVRFATQPPRIVQEYPDRQRSVLALITGCARMTPAKVSATLDDEATLLRQQQERTAIITSAACKADKHAVLRRALLSCERALADPENALVHLYEVRDAVVTHFGNEKNARKMLGVSKAQWNEFGKLANDEPVREGRHRGKYSGLLRGATHKELEVAFV